MASAAADKVDGDDAIEMITLSPPNPIDSNPSTMIENTSQQEEETTVEARATVNPAAPLLPSPATSNPTNEQIDDLPANSVVKLFCLVYLIGSLMLALVGRGLIGILQGIVGILFAIEYVHESRAVGCYFLHLKFETMKRVLWCRALRSSYSSTCKLVRADIDVDSC